MRVYLGEWFDVTIKIERKRRTRVAEPSRQLDGDDALLVPQGSAAVSEGVRVDAADRAHLPPDAVAVAPEGECLAHSFEEALVRLDPPTSALFGCLEPEPYAQEVVVDVVTRHGKSLRNSTAELLHYEDGNAYLHVETFEEADALARGGGIKFSYPETWQFYSSVAGRVASHPRVVQYEAYLRHKQPYGAGFVVRCEFAYPSAYPTDRKRVERFLSYVREYANAARAIPAYGAVGDGAPGSEPR